MDLYEVIVNNVEKITFTVLFILLLAHTIKQNEKRETEYREIIKRLSDLDNLTEKVEFVWTKIRDIQ